MKNRIMRCQLGFLLLGFLLAVLAAASFRVGSVSLSLQDIQAILSGTDRESTAFHILWDIRLPRLLAAALLGGALSVSGFLLQTFFSNPIAGPFVLGISSGAKLVVALVMILFLGKGLFMGSAIMIVAAFAGSMLSMGFVLVIAKRIRQMSVLVVCGVMISYICSAITDFVVTFADDANIVNLHNWSMGSFSGTTWDQVRVITAVVLPVFVLAFCMAKPISAYQLGEEYARSLGVNVKRFRAELILLSSVLSACVTAFAGPVSFVGIAVPQLVKRLFGTAKPIVVIPGCFLGGAVFCLFSDLIARTLFAPTELSISSVTAVFGAPVVIWIMIRRKGVQK
ncbi:MULTISPECIES: iron ABC transporter permease [unclassified Clostridium]|uniref:FecCD family ABC transporter permease n=1 Tax=unclassified Clostridium TaxID=2614128 RepID=UPI000E4F01E7|nr:MULTISPECIES: iron ABC transporter permease [unclassified Clostridium]RHP42638.1 iron ABC transporter permease [Clostridium sp. AF32-12BH]RHV64383.1 iron ABC transporter permease [Clostridium sp. OM02-18AC]